MRSQKNIKFSLTTGLKNDEKHFNRLHVRLNNVRYDVNLNDVQYQLDDVSTHQYRNIQTFRLTLKVNGKFIFVCNNPIYL